MLNKSEFGKIRQELARTEERREYVIQLSREIINLSKRIIYALHRDDVREADSLIKEIDSKKGSLLKNNIKLDINIDQVALQEYVEALCYYHFIKNRKIPDKAALKVDSESYLLGLCDLSGELVRKAVNEVVKNNFDIAFGIKGLVEEIYDEFLKFNLRNNELRKKSDQIKYNLIKLQDVIYELKMKGKLK
ncbi:hypothetical protein HYU09_00155 [Candidatus Woesearchaeota archaeon]|nr:hypothetical protein [Candidatus Woesearchaeota archaeon]